MAGEEAARSDEPGPAFTKGKSKGDGETPGVQDKSKRTGKKRALQKARRAM
jgi:hypothetical protein